MDLISNSLIFISMNKTETLSLVLAVLLFTASSCNQKQNLPDQITYSGNPVIEGWYADPEGIIFGDEYWIYPTYSDHYQFEDRSTEFSKKQLLAREKAINQQYLIQTFFNAFSSKDLVNWTKHLHV